MRNCFIVLASGLLTVACSQSYNDEVMVAAESMAESIEYMVAEDNDEIPVPQQEFAVETADRKIIKDGNMSVRVTDLKGAKAGIDSLLKRFKGYYAGDNYYTLSDRTGFSLNIRIPSSDFDRFIAAIEAGGGEITDKRINTRDVTDQYVDIETRLVNKREYLARYRELVRRAATVKDILEVEERIRNLEEEIESAEGRLRLLKNQISYSTLSLDLYRNTEYKFTPGRRGGFAEKMKGSLSTGWYAFVDFLLAMLQAWPFLIAIGAGIFFWIKRRHKRKAGKIR